MSLTKKYIEDQYIDNIKNYKYEGNDFSIYYKYIISPICNTITEYLPKWLMPNTITVMGWFLNFLSVVLTTYYGGLKGGRYLPPWLCYLASINYSLYIYLDAIDGKQARRLNASSPLGVLFDHGCDACTSFFITILAGSFFYYDNIYQYLLIYISLTFTFFLNFIEEYYTGVLDLPIINGVEEGSIYASFVFFISGYLGPDFYNKKYKIFNKYDLKISEMNGVAVFIGSVLHCLKSFYDIIKKSKSNKIGEIFKTSFVYILYTLSLLSVVVLNDSIIVKEYPKLLIMTFGFQVAKIYGIMQVSQILKCPLNLYRPVFLIPLLTLLIHSIIYYLFHFSLIVSIDTLIISALIWNILSWLHYVYFCSEEMCEILNINRFFPGKRYASRPAFNENKKLK